VWTERCPNECRRYRHLFFVRGLIISIATAFFIHVSSAGAGPVEDEALRKAAGCDGQPDVAVAKQALRLGGNPNALALRQPEMSFTPLQCAVNQAHHKEAVEVAKLLFAAGGKTRRPTFLRNAIEVGNIDMVRLLIENGVHPSWPTGYTPTEIALKYNHIQIYEYLLAHGGMPVNARDRAQIEFVHAAEKADKDSMERAIENGAQVNGIDSGGQSALVAALISSPVLNPSQAQAIWWLLDRKADPNQTLKDQAEFGPPLHIFIMEHGWTLKDPLKYPGAKSLFEKTLKRLLHAGARVSGMDSEGRTALHKAAERDNLLAAEVLIAEGAKIMARDKSGKTPLNYAESGPMIKLLKANGATEN
jgi:uncharacterized protein